VESEVQANALLKPIELAYSTTKANLENNGHHVGATFDEGSILTIDEKQYELLNLAVHTPSEHRLNGQAAEAEFQFFHQSSSKDKLVVSVLVDIGEANAEFDKIVRLFPGHKSALTVDGSDFNAAHLFPASKQYFQYRGSLTAPPCEEGVDVLVLKARVTISQAQLDEIKVKVPFSARPSQPLHGRSIQGSTYAEDASGAAIQSSAPAAAASSAEWTYCNTGPDNWGNLSPLFKLCKDGEHQSPINIVRGNVATDPRDQPLRFNYEVTDLIVQNAAQTIQINSNGKSSVEAAGKAYTLLQGHFYTPSEHLIDGAPAPMELHLVHKSEDNKMLIIAVLLVEGEQNNALAAFWSSLPRSKVTVDLKQPFDFASLLPKTAPTGYYHYSGSLSAPPCDENVNYYVLQEPITVSAEQIRTFQAIIPHNARPVNNLYGRKVTMPESGFVESGKDAANIKTLADAARSASSAAQDPTTIAK
jgi:carbonic anhydrase